MGIKERIFEHPLAALTGCITWAPIAVMIFAMISWAIQGDVEPMLSFLGVILCFGMGYVALVPPNDAYPPIICGICWLTVLGYPVARAVMDRYMLAQVDVEAVERVYTALGQRPLNPALRFRLAKLLYARGLVQEALAIAESVIQAMPRQFYRDEHLEIQRWGMQLRGPRQATFSCMNCHAENARGEIFCQTCGEPLMLGRAQGRWVGKKFMQQMLTIWVAIVTLILIIPFATSALPPLLGMVLICALVAVALYFVLKVLMPVSRDASA